MAGFLRAFDSAKMLDKLNFWAVVVIAACVLLEAFIVLRPNKRILSHFTPILSNKHEFFLLISITLLAVAIRLFRLSVAPLGFNVDEASISYDALCMANYGTDRFGVSNPAYLISWGSGQDVLYAWLIAPLFKIFGFSVFAARLPQAVLGALAVPIFYALVRQVSGRTPAVAAALLLAISPWHIMGSRWALVVYPLVPLLCGALLCFLAAQKRPWLYIPAFVLWALCLYAYLTSSLFLLPFLTMLFLYWLLHKKMTWKWFFAGAAAGFVVALPIVWFVLANNGLAPEFRTPFLSVVKLFIYRQDEVAGNIYQNGKSIADLLVWQRPHWANNFYDSVAIYGIVYLFSAPFAAGGAFALCRRAFQNFKNRTFSTETVWVFWLAAALFASLMIYPNTFNRCIPLAFIYIVLTVYGLAAALRRLPTLRAAMPVLYAVAFLLFCHSYFFTYAPDIAKGYNPGLMEAFQFADEVADGREILVPQNVGFFGSKSTYPYLCLNKGIPPGEFEKRYNTARNPEYPDSINLDNVHMLAEPFPSVAAYGGEKVYILDNETDPVWDYEAEGFTVRIIRNYAIAYMERTGG